MLNDLFLNPAPYPANFIKLFIVIFFASFNLLIFLISPKITKISNSKILKKTIKNSKTGMLFWSVITFFLIWMRLESVPFFSMRIWVWLVLFGFLIWLIFKVNFFLKTKKRILRMEKNRLKKS